MNSFLIRGSACRVVLVTILIGAIALPRPCAAQTNAGPQRLEVKADQVLGKVSPTLYGLMTEEINYSYEGGLYGELVRNRTFKDNATNAAHWHLLQDEGAEGAMALDETNPLNEALTTSLRLDVTKASSKNRVGIANEGFWGIPVRPNTKYRASFYARAKNGFKGPLTVAIVGTNPATVYASAQVRGIKDKWARYEVVLKTGKVPVSKDSQFVITAGGEGTIWFNVVSLFPPTYNDRPNGNRPDIMQLLADMKPAFLRFPGGNYLEGNTIETRFDWKKTIGDISERPGHMNDGWRYWSTDGMGLLEFLEWCEDLHMQPVLAVYAGYSMHQQHITPGLNLESYVQDALDEIEYVTGDTKTKWGARRAKDGHPAPFPLNYVEIGNEDWFDRSGSYDGRFAQYYDAIKAKHPKLQLIATTRVRIRTPDVYDDHFYRSSMQMQSDTHHYDKTDRSGPKVFVGEWATREGQPTPNMNAALGDAAWMTGMERNSDIVVMSCYAPLFVNVNRGAMQWRTDLIGYDTLTSYGSPAYYAQKMFNLHHGDTALVVSGDNIPTRDWQPPAARRRTNDAPVVAPSAIQVPTLFYNATRDTSSGTIFLKVVNTGGEPQNVQIHVSGTGSIEAEGKLTRMSSANPEDTNSIEEPEKIKPVTSKMAGLGTSFSSTFPAYSISILELKAK